MITYIENDLSIFEKDKEQIEKEKEIGKKEKRRQRVETFFKSFFGEENLKEIKKIFPITGEFSEIINELFNDEKKLVKSKKEELKETNRNIFQQIKKLDMYKDTSKLQEKIIFFLFPETQKKLKVDYRSTIRYIENENNTQITERLDKKDIPEFLINISKVSEYFLKKSENERKKRLMSIIGKNLFKNDSFRKTVENFYIIEDEDELNEINKILSKIKEEIIKEKELKIKIYKFFLFFLQLHYNMNEEQAFLNILEQVKEIEISNFEKNNLIIINSYIQDEFLMFLDSLNTNLKDNFKEEKLRSIYWYIYTVINDYKQEYISNIQKLSFYKGIYLNDFEYKKKKIFSYLDSHRKAEFILYIYDHLVGKREIPNYENVIYAFFTEKEVKNYLSKPEVKLSNKYVDSYSTDAENDYVINIIKLSLNNNKNKLEKEKELEIITSSYVEVKKKHGDFFNDQSVHRDVKIIIDFIYKLYYYSYVDYSIYLDIKKLILSLIELENFLLENLKNIVTLKNN